MELLFHGLALVVGAVLLSVLSENLAGRESFSLPLSNILLVVLVGGGLSLWWGWTSTLISLGIYGAFCVATGLAES